MSSLKIDGKNNKEYKRIKLSEMNDSKNNGRHKYILPDISVETFESISTSIDRNAKKYQCNIVLKINSSFHEIILQFDSSEELYNYYDDCMKKYMHSLPGCNYSLESSECIKRAEHLTKKITFHLDRCFAVMDKIKGAHIGFAQT